MKRMLLLGLVFAFVISFTSTAYAIDLPHSIDKLSKGTIEVVKSPLVIVDHTKGEMDKSDTKTFGLIKGLIESPFHVVKKAGGGVLDIVTFPLK